MSKARPGKVLMAAGGWGFHISKQSAHEGAKFVSPTYRPTLKHQGISLVLIYDGGWVHLCAIGRSEGLRQWNIPMTSSGIEAVTFRLVVQCLNQMRHCVLPYTLCPVSFPGVKRLGRRFNNPLPSIAKVKERVELYLYPPLCVIIAGYGMSFYRCMFLYRICVCKCMQYLP
jgi:hypothetical protein